MHRQAVEEMPTDHFAWLNLGDALRFSSQAEQAAVAYRRAIEISDELLALDPNSPLDLCVQAWATAVTGDEQRSLGLINRALNIAPNDPYVLYYDGLLKNDRGEEVEALRAFRLAVEMGYPAAMLAADPLLGDLHGDGRFERLVGESAQISIN
jgi:serine/threonine-protein kinase